MATGISSDAPIAVPDPEHSELDLIVQVHNRSRRVIESELQRLSRRAPSLGLAHLNVIDAALEDLTESLILHRLRNASRDTAPVLRRLFGTTTEDR
jgi:hypothetical protein